MAIYIDPTSPTNGVGTTADPKNTWDGITLVVNETYRQKRGTVCTLPAGSAKYIHANILASNPLTPLTLEAYYYSDGTDEPSLPRPEIFSNVTGNGAGTILLRSSSNVLIQNLKIATAPQSTYLLVGVKIWARTAGVFSGVTVRNCEITGHDYGISPTLSSTDAGAELTDITLEGNDIHDNIGGIVAVFEAPLTNYIRRYRVLNNKVHHNGQNWRANVVLGGILHKYPSSGTDPTRAYKDVIVDGNEVWDNEGYSISLYNVYNETFMSRVSRNHVHDNNQSEAFDSHSIFVARSFGVVVEENLIENNSGYAAGPHGTACGVLIDTDATINEGGDGCIVRRNVMDGGWPGYTMGGGGNESANGQAGVFVIDNTNVLIEDNYIRGFFSGIGTYANTGGTPATKLNGLVVRGNVIVDLLVSESDKNAVGIAVRSGMDVVIENNVFSNCRQGIWVHNSLTAPTERNNCVYAPRNGVYYARSASIDVATPTVALDATDIITDPMLYGRGRPHIGSPLFDAGRPSALRRRDVEGKQRPNPPSIGAYDRATLRKRLVTDPAL